jgi:D-threonine aldolase
MSERWFEVKNVAEIPSPALLIYSERVEENVRRMIAILREVGRLRPHIKTHKMAELIRLQVGHGIRKFKCATIAEAEMAARHGANDVLFAYQPVGPTITRLLNLACAFPKVRFSCLADNAASLQRLSKAVASHETDSIASILNPRAAEPLPRLEVLIDLDVGQHRTGIAPEAAFDLYRTLVETPHLIPGGLHAYDGHLHQSDVEERTAACEAALAPVGALRQKLEREGFPVPRVVAGGTPTFPMHAAREDVECSPGTCVFWDAGYARNLPDLKFLPAAVLLTRVVSKPTPNRLCLDLGHKAVASEMPHPRAVFLDLEDAKPVVHSEEHLVVETPHAARYAVGDHFYALPWHVCPTVALHSEAVVIVDGRAENRWKVVARDRTLNF